MAVGDLGLYVHHRGGVRLKLGTHQRQIFTVFVDDRQY